MISLLRSEIRRLTARRTVRLIAILILGIVLLTLGRTFLTSHTYSGGTPQSAIDMAEQVRNDCRNAEQNNPGEDFNCDQIGPESFFNDPRLHARRALPDATKAVAVGITIFAFAIGATYIGADWGAGTLQALLFWEPRRGRVLAAKAIALVAVVVAFLVAVEIIVYAGVWLTAATRGTTDGVTGGLHTANLLTMLRGAILVSFSALLGFAVAGLARHSGASLGAAFVYFVIVENLIRGLRPGWQRYLIGENFSAILTKRVDVARASARSINIEDGLVRLFRLTGVRGTITVGVYLALLLGAFYLAFTRRDVT